MTSAAQGSKIVHFIACQLTAFDMVDVTFLKSLGREAMNAFPAVTLPDFKAFSIPYLLR